MNYELCIMNYALKKGLCIEKAKYSVGYKVIGSKFSD